jgi:hypothetical protein
LAFPVVYLIVSTRKHNKKFSLAKNFIQNLCLLSQSKRYDVRKALAHPFITRDFGAEIPRDPNEFLINVHLEHKIRRGVYLVTFLSCIRNHSLHGSSELPPEYLRKLREASQVNETMDT